MTYDICNMLEKQKQNKEIGLMSVWKLYLMGSILDVSNVSYSISLIKMKLVILFQKC